MVMVLETLMIPQDSLIITLKKLAKRDISVVDPRIEPCRIDIITDRSGKFKSMEYLQNDNSLHLISRNKIFND